MLTLHKVCNGVRDCPEGEDEDSVLWFQMDFNLTYYGYQNNTRSWANINTDQTCFRRNSNIRISTLIIILCSTAILLAILLVSK